MFSKLKQIKELRQQAKTIQNTLSEIVVEGSAARGGIKIRMNGNQEVMAVEIADELLGQKKILTEAVREAVNEAMKKAQREMARKMKESGGFDALKNLGL